MISPTVQFLGILAALAVYVLALLYRLIHPRATDQAEGRAPKVDPLYVAVIIIVVLVEVFGRKLPAANEKIGPVQVRWLILSAMLFLVYLSRRFNPRPIRSMVLTEEQLQRRRIMSWFFMLPRLLAWMLIVVGLFLAGLKLFFSPLPNLSPTRYGDRAAIHVRGVEDAREHAFPTALASGGPQLIRDQVDCTANNFGGLATVSGDTWKAQVFTPGLNGTLKRVELAVSDSSGKAVLHIRSSDAAGLPTGPDLARVIGERGRFELATGVRMQRGERYALLLSGDPAERVAWAYADSRDCYAGGLSRPLTSLDAGRTWSPDILDFLFATYMLSDPS